MPKKIKFEHKVELKKLLKEGVLNTQQIVKPEVASQETIKLDEDITKEVTPEYSGLKPDTKLKYNQRKQNETERKIVFDLV